MSVRKHFMTLSLQFTGCLCNSKLRQLIIFTVHSYFRYIQCFIV